MRIGLIARADHTGLGIQSLGFYRNIPCKALVIDFHRMGQPHSAHILEPDFSRFPNEQVFTWGTVHRPFGGIPPEIIENFVKDLDILFCMETPYDYEVFNICKRKKVKTVLQLNYEFLDYPSDLPYPTLFAAPSLWNYDLIPNPKCYLPVPAEPQPVMYSPNTFLHVAGRHAVHDRNGTQTLFDALNYVRNDITLIVRAQQDTLFVPPNRRSNITMVVDTKNKKSHLENYTGGVLVMPRKYGGLCLPMNEAISFGMPVIATDISPNNTWLPREWLVEANHCGQLRGKKTVEMFEANPVKLGQMIDDFCNMYPRAHEIAKDLRDSISWERLKPRYLEVFNELLSQGNT